MSKGFSKGKLCGEFRPVTCLPLKWKLLTGIIVGDMYYFMENENLLPEEQRGAKWLQEEK